MRDDSVGDVDGEAIGRIARASLRHENEFPRSVVGRASLRDRAKATQPAIIAENKSFITFLRSVVSVAVDT
jgi:hypothetical protein